MQKSHAAANLRSLVSGILHFNNDSRYSSGHSNGGDLVSQLAAKNILSASAPKLLLKLKWEFKALKTHLLNCVESYGAGFLKGLGICDTSYFSLFATLNYHQHNSRLTSNKIVGQKLQFQLVLIFILSRRLSALRIPRALCLAALNAEVGVH